MLDGSGGGYAGTNWHAHDVMSMWQRISLQATDAHDEVSLGWKRTAELTSTHLSRVTEYRNNLAAAWPPEKSEASAAYVAQLNKLIASLTETHKAASANYSAFSSVASVLASTRQIIEPIFHEYVTNQARISQWQADKDAAAAKASSTPNGTPTPLPSPQASPLSASPPVSATRQEQLNNLARSAMFELSSTIISGQSELRKPAPYTPVLENRTRDGDSSTTTTPGISIPPLIPVPVSSVNDISVKPHTPASAPTFPIGSGPTLSGALPPTLPVVTPPLIGGLPVPPNTSLGIPGVIGLPGMVAPGNGGGLLPGSGLPGNGLIRPGMGFGTEPITGMPSGNVIGARPGTGMIGQVPTGGRGSGVSPNRVNPVGGVIGSQPGVGSPMNSGGRSGQRMSETKGQPGSMTEQHGRDRRRGQNEDHLRWDPYDPWLTEMGVDPVVLPPDDPGPIDPGPAIGLTR